MKIFESHVHYDDERFDKDRDELLEKLNEEIDVVVNIGADIESSKRSILLSKMYDYIYAAIGVHPHDVKNLKDEDLLKLEEMAKEKKVIAIGEIGLDYYYDNSPRELQKDWFKKQLALAKKLKMPVSIHSRDASKDTFDIIKASGVREGVIHCFSEGKEMAKEYVKLGYYLGIGGVLTYKNARKLVEVVEEIDIEHLVIETDGPYLSPEPNRGKRNDSRNLKYVIAKIAEIKEMEEEEVAEITYNNAKKMYRI
ncbi:MAG: TatD family hydrolase [Clostridia bacterium]|jgi:TatD DNase family protein|nr:TatD family hydrolase [Clostridia bacterium]